jgi:hypothetical protein
VLQLPRAQRQEHRAAPQLYASLPACVCTTCFCFTSSH